MKTILITGATSGIGKDLINILDNKNYNLLCQSKYIIKSMPNAVETESGKSWNECLLGKSLSREECQTLSNYNTEVNSKKYPKGCFQYDKLSYLSVDGQVLSCIQDETIYKNK